MFSSSLKYTDNSIYAHFWVVLQILKPPSNGRSQLHEAQDQVDPQTNCSLRTNDELDNDLWHHPVTSLINQSGNCAQEGHILCHCPLTLPLNSSGSSGALITSCPSFLAQHLTINATLSSTTAWRQWTGFTVCLRAHPNLVWQHH